MSCPICLNTYTLKNRKEIKCQYCPVSSCLSCLQQYILSSVEDCHCHSCKNRWTVDFMNMNFPLIFRVKTLRMHRRKVLHSREKSLLPDMQRYVEAKRNYDTASHLQDEIELQFKFVIEEFNNLNSKLKIARNKYNTAIADPIVSRNDKSLINTYRSEYNKSLDDVMKYRRTVYRPMKKTLCNVKRQVNNLLRIYETGEGNAETQTRREFLMRCPGEDCRGFISNSYICGICSKKTCSNCIEILTTDHTCKPECVESAKAIKQETRSCPKCATRIFKIDGCDQMWCTVNSCNTAFSWNTGNIVSGRIHNPHYYEWLRTQPNVPREPGDIPCGGLPDQRLFIYRTMLSNSLTPEEKTTLLEINRNLAEFEERLHNYPMQVQALANKDINIKYLMKQIDETEWQRQLEFNESRFIRKREIGQILQTLVTVSAEIMRNIYERLIDNDGDIWIRNEALKGLEELRQYTNKAFVVIGNQMKFAVPQISENWRWINASIHYRTKAEPPPLDLGESV